MKTLTLRGREFRNIAPATWRLDPTGKMKVGVHLIGTASLLERISGDKSVDQAIAVSTLPGVLDPVLTMADIHQGYGFPIGGVAAFHPKTGVISPGGVGYDINCGVRMLTTSLSSDSLRDKATLKALVDDLFQAVPAGVGSKRQDLSLRDRDLDELLCKGAAWAVEKGFGDRTDVDVLEDRGCLPNADTTQVSARAKERGMNQLGTLGSGNHFLEIQIVDEIFDNQCASVFGLKQNQVVVSIHTGSRGLGYQTCADYLEITYAAAKKYGINLTRELAAAPIESPEGKSYFGAMAAAANFAFANRQVIAHWVRQVLQRHFKACEVVSLYDVCHNIAKMERFGKREVCIHRKGATRAYPKNHALVPAKYRDVGQPVIVPGDMGRSSYVLVGNPQALESSFGSACHGAGRQLSRTQAKKLGKGRPIARELEAKGIHVRTSGRGTLLEEMPEAYKDVTEVVEATAAAGLASLVARLRPVGVVKG